MNRIALLTMFMATSLTVAPVTAKEPSAESIRFFEQKVRPLLSSRCTKCHGEKKQESGLRLDSAHGFRAGGDSETPLIIVGKPNESLLIQAVRHTGDYEMPPDEKLSRGEIETLVTWVKLGAPWPKSANTKQKIVSIEERIKRHRSSHWAYRPIERPKLPAVHNADWPQTAIDFFVLAKLEANKLSPSPPASRATLLRRLKFDLLGLPPVAEEVSAFAEDPQPFAREKLIERYLASPHYGERWGRHWLDVARYSDTQGQIHARERSFPYSYTYRDYVISAFNRDLPFDRFVLEQLAADKLPDRQRPAPLAALGFLTLGRKYKTIHDDIDDQIDTVTRGLLGLTVSCARCHDHKYDAIPTDDYYSLYGVFANCHEPRERPLLAKPEATAGYEKFNPGYEKHWQALANFERAKHTETIQVARQRTGEYLEQVISEGTESLLGRPAFISLLKDELKPRIVYQWAAFLKQTGNQHPVFGSWHQLLAIDAENYAEQASQFLDRLETHEEGTANGKVNPLVKQALMNARPKQALEVARAYGALFATMYKKHEAKQSDAGQDGFSPAENQLLEILVGKSSPIFVPMDSLKYYLARTDLDHQQKLIHELKHYIVHTPGAPPRAMILADRERIVEPRVFIRGNPIRPGEQVPRRFLAVLEANRQSFGNGSGRLGLARAIVDAKNPLTARVIANRVWQHHFGEPLVSTPSDFGVRSDPPSHPELLDYLAAGLIENSWSLKWLHREILNSATYAQSSRDRMEGRTIDPQNRLLWRMNRRRLEVEAMRDAMLFVAGRLDTKLAGPPVDVVKAPFSQRRMVYGYVDRQDLPKLFRNFDFANPDQSSAGRPRTTVPQQALFMLNSPFVVEQAKALAAREEITKGYSDDARVTALYRVIFARTPSPSDVETARRFLAQATSGKPAPGENETGVKLSRWEQYAQVLLLTNEFLFVD